MGFSCLASTLTHAHAYTYIYKHTERHHVDLVRCHEHPQLEGEYVVQISHSSYLVWNPSLKPCLRPQWEWHLKHIRRVHWHKNVNKLEVEPGRYVSAFVVSGSVL